MWGGGGEGKSPPPLHIGTPLFKVNAIFKFVVYDLEIRTKI